MINAVVIVYVFAYEILRVIYRDSFTLYSRFARHQNVSFFFFFIDTDFLFYFIESTRVVLICNINREEKGKNTIQHVSLVCVCVLSVCTFKYLCECIKTPLCGNSLYVSECVGVCMHVMKCGTIQIQRPACVVQYT